MNARGEKAGARQHDKPITIGIDARWIFAEISGIGEYTRELIKHLAQIDHYNRYVLFFRDKRLKARTMAALKDAANFRSHVLPYGLFSPWNQCLFPQVIRRYYLDVFHSTNYMIPLLSFPRGGKATHKTRCVVTIHDVIPLLFPDHAPHSKKARVFPLYRYLMKEIARRADVIITDSRASRGDVIRCLHIIPEDESKVHAVPIGYADRFKPLPEEKRIAHKPKGTSQTILYVGRADPYKNITTLIRSFQKLRERMPNDVVLKIAGAPDPRYREAALLVEKLGLTDNVIWTGYLPDEELVSAYRDADVLAHPSRYEGFGLQVLEAMACGLPVVCSNAGSLPEVAGDAAVLVHPGDVEALAERLREVLTDPDLAARLSEKGKKQAENFAWRKTAADTLALYNACAGKTPRG